MAFKFAVMVMNCLQPNFPDSFDLLGTVETFDTYLNLKLPYLTISRLSSAIFA